MDLKPLSKVDKLIVAKYRAHRGQEYVEVDCDQNLF